MSPGKAADGAPLVVLLMAFGGPDEPGAVGPFIANLTGGRELSPAVLARAKERYDHIGGRSPLLDITTAQAKALEELLRSRGIAVKVYVGMRYWHPFIGETMNRIEQEGAERIVALSMSPYYSRVTTGTYLAALQAAQGRIARPLQVIFTGSWHDHPLLVEALAEKINQALASIPADRLAGTSVVFTAHSLPVSHIQGGDPYVEELTATVRVVASKLGLRPWQLAYQSKGGGQGEWLGPAVEEVLHRLAGEGVRQVLVSPAGFMADHVETLYDLDIEARGQAEKLGLIFQRVSALNTSPKLIAALADMVAKAISSQRE